MRLALVSDRRASGAAAGPGPGSEAAAAAAGQLSAPARRPKAGIESGQQSAVGPVVEAAEAPVQPRQQGDGQPDSKAAVSLVQSQQQQQAAKADPGAERKPGQDVQPEDAKRAESQASQQVGITG